MRELEREKEREKEKREKEREKEREREAELVKRERLREAEREKQRSAEHADRRDILTVPSRYHGDREGQRDSRSHHHSSHHQVHSSHRSDEGESCFAFFFLCFNLTDARIDHVLKRSKTEMTASVQGNKSKHTKG